VALVVMAAGLLNVLCAPTGPSTGGQQAHGPVCASARSTTAPVLRLRLGSAGLGVSDPLRSCVGPEGALHVDP